MRKRQFAFAASAPQTSHFGVTLRTTQTEGQSKQYLTGTQKYLTIPQNCQSREKQGGTKKLSKAGQE